MIQLIRTSSSHRDGTTVAVDRRSAAAGDVGERVSSLDVPLSPAAAPGCEFAIGPVRQGIVASEIGLQNSVKRRNLVIISLLTLAGCLPLLSKGR